MSVELHCESEDCHILLCDVLMLDLLTAKTTGALISAYMAEDSGGLQKLSQDLGAKTILTLRITQYISGI